MALSPLIMIIYLLVGFLRRPVLERVFMVVRPLEYFLVQERVGFHHHRLIQIYSLLLKLCVSRPSFSDHDNEEKPFVERR